MYAALQLGLFAEGAGTMALKLTARSQDQDIEKSSMQMDREEMRKARRASLAIRNEQTLYALHKNSGVVR